MNCILVLMENLCLTSDLFWYRSWFQEHVVSILLGILLVVLVTLSAIVVVLVWRKKFSGQTAYRPVDSVAPEQELQPL